MSQSRDVLTKWKIQLESREKSDHLKALVDIVTVINSVNTTKEDGALFNLSLIDSEMCHYLAELLIYKWQATTSLINKIICHISELEKFFKHDFFKIIRGYLRLINSFPPMEHEIRFAYRNSIISTAAIILKRAQHHGVDFNDKRMPAVCLLTSANSVIVASVSDILALDYVSLVLDIMTSVKLSEKDKKFQYQKVLGIIRTIHLHDECLSDELYCILVSNTIHHTLGIVSQANQSKEEQLITSILAEKLLELMGFIIGSNTNILCYEVFCNMLYHMFVSRKIPQTIKSLIVNRCIILNGHEMLIETIRNDVVAFKSRVVFAEMIFHLSKTFHTTNDGETDDGDAALDSLLRPIFMNIAFNADFEYERNYREQASEPSGDTIMLTVIKSYINMRWNKEMKSKGELLSMLAYFLEIMKRRKIQFNNGVFSMLMSLYTTSFVNIQIKENQLLQTSSSTILKYYKRFNVAIDLKFIQWWFTSTPTVSSDEYEKLIMQFIATSCNGELDELTENDLYVFDRKFLIKLFLNQQTSIDFSHNLAKIISRFAINSRDFERVMKAYETNLSSESSTKVIDLLEIMSINALRVTPRIRNATLVLMQRALNAMRKNISERAMAIRLSAVAMSCHKCSLLDREN